jgi:hypothetical protein
MRNANETRPNHTPLSNKIVTRSFFARFFVRNHLQEPEATTECADVQQIIAEGHRIFPNFSARNPWIFSDSIRGRAWIFLDPDTSKRSS